MIAKDHKDDILVCSPLSSIYMEMIRRDIFSLHRMKGTEKFNEAINPTHEPAVSQSINQSANNHINQSFRESIISFTYGFRYTKQRNDTRWEQVIIKSLKQSIHLSI